MRIPEFRPLPPTGPDMPLVTTPIAHVQGVHAVGPRSLPPLRYQVARRAGSAPPAQTDQAVAPPPIEHERQEERRHEDRRHHTEQRLHLYDFRAHVDRRRMTQRTTEAAEHIDVLA